MADLDCDPEPDANDLIAIAALSAEDVHAIDESIVASTRAQWRKTAMVVVMAMDAYPDRFHDIPDVYYSQRVMALVAQGRLQARGNLTRMRFSEIRQISDDV